MEKPLVSNKRSYSQTAREKMMLFFTGPPEKERPSRTKAIIFPLKVCYDRTLVLVHFDGVLWSFYRALVRLTCQFGNSTL